MQLFGDDLLDWTGSSKAAWKRASDKLQMIVTKWSRIYFIQL